VRHPQGRQLSEHSPFRRGLSGLVC